MRFSSPHRCRLVRSAWLVLGVVSLSLPNLSAAQALAAGSHVVLLKSAGFPDYTRTIEIPKASKLTLKAVFQPAASP